MMHWLDQPRVPRGVEEGGEWTDDPAHWAMAISSKIGNSRSKLTSIIDTPRQDVDPVFGEDPEGRAVRTPGPRSAELLGRINDLMAMTDPSTGMSAGAVSIRGAHGRRGSSDGVLVNFRFMDRNGKDAGGAALVFHRFEGIPTLEISTVAVDKAYRRGGFGTRWVDSIEQAAKEQGFEQARLDAAGEGGLFWARRGYRFETPADGQKIADAFAKAMRRPSKRVAPLVTDRARQQVEQLQARQAAGDIPEPWEWSEVGKTGSSGDWLGKRVMDGSNWDGIKQL